jgi:hypothetical protein
MARELSLEIYSITLTICQQKKRNKGQRQEACLKCSSETGLQAPFPSRGPHISGGSVILNDRRYSVWAGPLLKCCFSLSISTCLLSTGNLQDSHGGSRSSYIPSRAPLKGGSAFTSFRGRTWVVFEYRTTTTIVAATSYLLRLVGLTKPGNLVFPDVQHCQIFLLTIFFQMCSICVSTVQSIRG